MTEIKQVLKEIYQGLPGIGINGDGGDKGERGNSVYIGYLKSFFDYTSLSNPNYAYLREKNLKNNDSIKNNFYYRDDENFLWNEKNQSIVTFSLYNLRAIYYDKTPDIELDETRNKRVYKNFILKDDFANRKRVDEQGNPVLIKGFCYLDKNFQEAYEKWDETAMNNWKRYNTDISDAFFPTKVSLDYIEERRRNETQTNFNQNLTEDVVVPTSLKDIFNVGDILYVLDDITGEIISYIVITEEIRKCSFAKFLEQDFVACDSLKSTFVVNGDRIYLDKDFYIPEVKSFLDKNVNLEKGDELRFRKNFVKRIKGSYPLNIPYNSVSGSERRFFALQTDKLDKDFVLIHSDDKDSLTKTKNNIVFRAPNFKLENLFIKNIDTNVNIKEYNDFDIKFVGKYKHLFPLEDKDFIVSEENNTVTIKINSSSFFENSNDITEKFFYFGVEIYKKEKDNSYTVLEKIENHSSVSEIEFRFPLDWFEDGMNFFGFITSIRGNGISTSHSLMTELEIKCQKTDSDFRITRYTFHQPSTLNLTEVDDDFDNEYCSFVLSEINCEEQDNASMDIVANQGCFITDVYIGNSHVLSRTDEGVYSKKDYNGSWIKIKESDMILGPYDDNVFNSLKISKIHIDDNLQDFIRNGEVVKPTTIGECLSEMSKVGYRIGSKIQETEDRNIVFTVITRDPENNNTHRSSFIFNQPGFSNPLKDVNISFGNLFKKNKIEESNKPENGILCNQLQMFTEVNVDNFNNDSWGQYFDNPRIRINVKLDTDTASVSGSQSYCDETNYNNVHIYSVFDKNKYPNNAVKTKFYWLKGNQGIKIDSKISDLNKNSVEFEKYILLKRISSLSEIGPKNDWVPLNIPELDRNIKVYGDTTTIPYDFNYVLEESVNGSNSIGGEYGLTFEEVNNPLDKVKIRTFCEVANPIPMEFNFRWRVSSIEILGQLKQEYKDSWKNKQENAETDKDILFKKLFDDSVDNLVLSENVKYIINPVYMTLCPEDVENQKPLQGSVKIVGSDEGILLKTGISDIDERTKDEFFKKGMDNTDVRYSLSKIITNDNIETVNISDITHYFPKKKYFQDNISNISIVAKTLKKQIEEGLVTTEDSSFLTINDFYLKKNEIVQSKFNLIPIDWEESVNESFSDNYIQMSFNAEYMNPLLRKGEVNFYFNDKLYPYDKYNQWNSVSPLWVKCDINNKIVDSNYMESKQVWNYEYEVSPKYKDSNVFGGVLTKSGNGFSNLNEDADTGQYDADKYLSLSELKKQSEEKVMEEPKVVEINYPEGYVHQPDKNCFYRGMLFKAEWIYPNFRKVKDDIKVYPYLLTNSYESYLDSIVMKGLITEEVSDDMVSKYIFDKCNDENIFGSGDSSASYLSRKYKKGAWSVANGMKTQYMNQVSLINLMIPYNLMFDIYPRTMYNTDMVGNVINVLMLQQPSTVSDGTYEFDNQYYEIKKEDKSPILPPWNFDV